MIDPFWLVDAKTNVNLHQPNVVSQPLGNSKPTTTKETRLASIRQTFEPLAQLSSNSNLHTDNLISTIHQLFRNLSNDKVNSLVANPLVVSGQSQKRRQPNAVGAPTTAANKAASRASNKEKRKK